MQPFSLLIGTVAALSRTCHGYETRIQVETPLNFDFISNEIKQAIGEEFSKIVVTGPVGSQLTCGSNRTGSFGVPSSQCTIKNNTTEEPAGDGSGRRHSGGHYEDQYEDNGQYEKNAAEQKKGGIMGIFGAICLMFSMPEELKLKDGPRIGDVGKDTKEDKLKRHDSNLTALAMKKVKTTTAKDAVNCVDNDFGSWGPAAKALFFGHLMWLCKEIFWILLIPYPAFGFGILTLVCFATALMIRGAGGEVAKFYQEKPVEAMIQGVQFSWQLFNVNLMFADFMFSVPDEVPGYAEDMLLLSGCDSESSCEDGYEAMAWISRVGFGLVFLAWLGTSIFMLYKFYTPPNLLAQGYALQTCLLQGGWIAFWVLKDFDWSFDSTDTHFRNFTVVAWAIHFLLLLAWLFTHTSPLLLIDGINEQELKQIKADIGVACDRGAISYIFWSLASLLWFICEVYEDGKLAYRYIGAGLCGLSFILYASSYYDVKAKARANDLFIKRLRDKTVQEAAADDAGTPVAEAVGKAEGADLPGKTEM